MPFPRSERRAWEPRTGEVAANGFETFRYRMRGERPGELSDNVLRGDDGCPNAAAAKLRDGERGPTYFDGDRGGTSPAAKMEAAPAAVDETRAFFGLVRLTKSASQVAVSRPCSGRLPATFARLRGGDVPG